MKTRFLLILSLLVWAYASANALEQRNLLQQKASQEQLKNFLMMDQQWVPYPTYTDRAAWDHFLGHYKQDLIHRGETVLKYQWQVVPATAYMEFDRSGNRRVMEDPFHNNTRTLATLVMAELAEGKGRFIDQIINGVYCLSEMTSWALSAHIGAVQSDRKALPDKHTEVMDLGSGNLSQLLSWTYYFLHEEFDKINPLISKRLREEIQQRELDPFVENNHYWWMAREERHKNFVNNWNPWCNSNALLSYMLLENDKDKLARAVYLSMVSVDQFINYVKEDGACEEGPSYWGHASGKLFDYLQMLYYITGGRISIFDEPQIRNMGEYIVQSFVGDNWVVNFADASAKGSSDVPLIYRYGLAVGSPLMKSFAAQQSAERGHQISVNFGEDLFRSFEALLHLKEIQKEPTNYKIPDYCWYPETEFCYMHNEEGFFVACKGGFNNESHNHNDVGTFSLYLDNRPILIDVGVGTYTRQTFSSERYKIWTMQSNYHNLPMINGVPQQYGNQFKATGTTFNPKRRFFSTDISKAYPKQAKVKEWIRAYHLGKQSVTVQDRFELTEAAGDNQINFMTWGKVDISRPGCILIEVDGRKVTIRYKASQFTAGIETVALTDRRLSNVWGKEIYRISLNAKKKEMKGNYTYTITKE